MRGGEGGPAQVRSRQERQRAARPQASATPCLTLRTPGSLALPASNYVPPGQALPTAPHPLPRVQRAEFAFKHFEADPNTSFALLEEDPVTKRPVSTMPRADACCPRPLNK